MIICVYLNPTIDKTVYFDEFIFGGTNRPTKVILNGAGKAINAAAVLKELGQDVFVMGLLYHSDGQLMKSRLDSANIGYDFLEAEGASRVNTKIFDGKTKTITEINESGQTVSSEMMETIARNVYEKATEDDVVILTGSLPPGCDKNIYAQMIARLNQKGARCVLDADGEVLALGIKEKPYFIKPNIDELKSIVALPDDSMKSVIDASRKIIDGGVVLIGISMGAGGALMISKDEAVFAKPMKVDVKSTVGAGDSMVAGITAALDMPMDVALKTGVAAATGSITLEGTNLCTKELFDHFFPLIETETV